MGRAVDYLQNIGFNRIHEHEQHLLRYATGKLEDLPGIQIIGNSQNKAGVISFVVEGIHPHDIGTLLNEEGVAIRTGHHCAQPVMEFFSIPATARASFYFYNTPAEVDQLVEAVKNAKKIFGC